MSIECESYGAKRLSIFPSRVVVPEIRLNVKTRYGYRKEWFLVDTGADITMLPKSATDYLDCTTEITSERMYGIDGTGVGISKSGIWMEICGEEHKVRCVVSERDDIPFILGRLDILDGYDILLLRDKVCLQKREA